MGKSESFNERSNAPYGVSVLYKELPNLFENNKIRTVYHAPFRPVVLHGFLERLDIDPLVFVETRILGDNDGTDHVLGNGFEWHRVPAQAGPFGILLTPGLVAIDKIRSLDRTGLII